MTKNTRRKKNTENMRFICLIWSLSMNHYKFFAAIFFTLFCLTWTFCRASFYSILCMRVRVYDKFTLFSGYLLDFYLLRIFVSFYLFFFLLVILPYSKHLIWLITDDVNGNVKHEQHNRDYFMLNTLEL